MAKQSREVYWVEKSNFLGFGLLVKNTEGKWTINGQVVEAGEKIKIEGYFSFEEALEGKANRLDFVFYAVVSIDKAFESEEGIVCFDVQDDFEDWNPAAFYAVKAQRMVD